MMLSERFAPLRSRSLCCMITFTCAAAGSANPRNIRKEQVMDRLRSEAMMKRDKSQAQDKRSDSAGIVPLLR